MQVYVLRIAKSKAYIEKAKISEEDVQEQNTNNFLDYCIEDPLKDDIRDVLLESYDHKLFIPGNGDMSFKLVKDFRTVFGEIKLKVIKDLLEEMTPENYHTKQRLLRLAVTGEFILYINEQNTYNTIPLDEWIMTLAEEDVEYIIVQQFDAHIQTRV